MVPVAIHPQRGVAEAARVDQAGVAEPVGVEDRAVFRQRSDQAQVGLVSGREHQSGFDAFESRQALFQLPMGTQTPGHQPRGPRPDAVAADGVDGGFGHPRMGGKVQVVIGGEEKNPATVQFDLGAGRGVDRAQSPVEGTSGQGIQAGAVHGSPHTV